MPAPIEVAVVPVTPFQQNCTFLWCADSRKGVVVDPGGEVDVLLKTIDQQKIEIERILITHGHIDHVGGGAALRDALGVPIEGPHIADKFWLESIEQQCSQFGLPEGRTFEPDRWLSEGDTVRFGAVEMSVLHCPGHTPGHIVFYHDAARMAVVGDVLFNGSIGRTDFPRGSFEDLLASIREKLWPLGDDVTFIPGHGPTSTFGHERRTNPFCGEDAD